MPPRSRTDREEPSQENHTRPGCTPESDCPPHDSTIPTRQVPRTTWRAPETHAFRRICQFFKARPPQKRNVEANIRSCAPVDFDCRHHVGAASASHFIAASRRAKTLVQGGFLDFDTPLAERLPRISTAVSMHQVPVHLRLFQDNRRQFPRPRSRRFITRMFANSTHPNARTISATPPLIS